MKRISILKMSLEMLYNGELGHIKKKQDAVVCFVHSWLITKGFKCIGKGEEIPKENIRLSDMLPSGWSADDIYSLIYQHQTTGDNYLLKFDSTLLLYLMRIKDLKVSSVDVNPSDYVTNNLSSYAGAFHKQNLDSFSKRLTAELLGLFEVSDEDRSQSDPFSRPEWEQPTNPIGLGDLDPLAGGMDSADDVSNEAIVMQQHRISCEIVESQALISRREDFTSLLNEYAGDSVFQEKVKRLHENYSFLRRTRGDGNCCYRAFGFAYMERLIQDRDEFQRFQPLADKSKDELVALGFPQTTIEDFHATFMEVLDRIGAGCTSDELLKLFNEQDTSDCVVVFLRLMVSGHLQKEKDFYSNFINDNRSMKQYCFEEVEPMGKDIDHVHIIALTTSTLVPVRIEYMDRGNAASPSVNHHDFPDSSNPKIFLLYRPGHYDILYE